MLSLRIDLDGVLADFEKAAILATGTPFVRGDNEIWKKLQEHPNFFRTIPLMPDAMKLWVYLRLNFTDIEILTAIPRNGTMPDAAVDKRFWVKDHFGDGIKVNTCLAVEKQQFCTGPDCILIDDNVKNIFQWSMQGGLGIFHVNAEETISCIKWFKKAYPQHFTGEEYVSIGNS